MPFATQLYFDQESAARIRALWQALAESGVAPHMYGCGARPHLTLGIYQGMQLPACEQTLQALSARTAPFALSFSHLGVFNSGEPVVFVAPSMTLRLFGLHTLVDQQLQGVGEGAYGYYLPGSWVPHCTLALELPSTRLSQALEAALALPLPFEVTVRELGLIEFTPVRQLCCFPLSGE